MHDSTKAFTDWLQKELDTRGWSQSELGRRANLASATISYVLSGNTNPGFEFCKKVALAFGVSPERILRMAGLLPPEPEPTANSKEANQLFSQLTDEEQEIVLAQMRALVERRRRQEMTPG